MKTMNSDKFVPYILGKNGNRYQAIKACEELSELAYVLARYSMGECDREHIAEETADVILMCRQICAMFNIDDLEIEQRIQYKIDRYFEREKVKNAKD
jgi:NTP pyrophosphatase (non-canonical NTP hydrolase)